MSEEYSAVESGFYFAFLNPAPSELESALKEEVGLVQGRRDIRNSSRIIEDNSFTENDAGGGGSGDCSTKVVKMKCSVSRRTPPDLDDVDPMIYDEMKQNTTKLLNRFCFLNRVFGFPQKGDGDLGRQHAGGGDKQNKKARPSADDPAQGGSGSKEQSDQSGVDRPRKRIKPGGGGGGGKRPRHSSSSAGNESVSETSTDASSTLTEISTSASSITTNRQPPLPPKKEGKIAKSKARGYSEALKKAKNALAEVDAAMDAKDERRWMRGWKIEEKDIEGTEHEKVFEGPAAEENKISAKKKKQKEKEIPPERKSILRTGSPTNISLNFTDPYQPNSIKKNEINLPVPLRKSDKNQTQKEDSRRMKMKGKSITPKAAASVLANLEVRELIKGERGHEWLDWTSSENEANDKDDEERENARKDLDKTKDKPIQPDLLAFMKSTKVLNILNLLMGLNPYKSVVRSNQCVQIKWEPMSMEYIGVCLNAFIFFMTTLGIFSSLIIILGYDNRTTHQIVKVEFAHHFLEAMFLTLLAFFLTVWSVSCLLELGVHYAEFYTRFNLAICLTKYDVTEGIHLMIVRHFTTVFIFELTIITLFFAGRTKTGIVRSGAGFIGFTMLRPFNFELRESIYYPFAEIFGLVVFTYFFLSLNVVLIQFTVYAKAMGNMAKRFNLRMAYAFGSLVERYKDGTEKRIKKAIPFKKLFAEHQIIASLYRNLGHVNAIVFGALIFSMVCQIVLVMWLCFDIALDTPPPHYKGVIIERTGSVELAVPIKLQLHDAERLMRAAVIFAITWMTYWIFGGVMHNAGDTFQIGIEYIRRYGLIRCKSSKERRFMLSMMNSFAPKNPYWIGKKFHFNRSSLLGLMSFVIGASMVTVAFRPDRLSLASIETCDEGGQCSAIQVYKTTQNLFYSGLDPSPPPPASANTKPIPPSPPPISTDLDGKHPPNLFLNYSPCDSEGIFPWNLSLLAQTCPSTWPFLSDLHLTFLYKPITIADPISNEYKFIGRVREPFKAHEYEIYDKCRKATVHDYNIPYPNLFGSPPSGPIIDCFGNEMKEEDFDDCGNLPFDSRDEMNMIKEAVLRAVSTGELPGISDKSIVCCYEYPGYEKSEEQVKTCSTPDAEVFLEVCKFGTKSGRLTANPHLLQHNNRIVARIEYEKGKGNLNYSRDHEATIKDCLCKLKDPQPTVDSKESCTCVGLYLLPCLPDHFNGVSQDFFRKCGPVMVPLLFKTSSDQSIVFYGEHTRYKDDCTEPEFSDIFNHDDSLTYSRSPCGSNVALGLTDCAGKLVVLGDVNKDDCSNWRIATPDSTGNMIQPRLSVRAYNYDGSKKEIVETKSNRKIFLCCFQYTGQVFRISEQDKYCNAPNVAVMNKDKWCKSIVATNNGIRQLKGGFSKEKNEQLQRKLDQTVRYHEKIGSPSWLDTLAVNDKWAKCICPDKIEGFNEAQYEQARLNECKPLIATPQQLYSKGVIDPFPYCAHQWTSVSNFVFMMPAVFIFENYIWEMPDRFKKKEGSQTNPCYVDSSYKEVYTNDGNPQLYDLYLNPLAPLRDDCGSPPFTTIDEMHLKKEAVLRAINSGDLPGVSEKSIVCCYAYPGHDKSEEQVKACSTPDAEVFLDICKLGSKIERFKANPHLLQHNNRIVARIEYEKGIKGNLNYLRDHEATVNNCLCKLKDPQPTIDSKESCECNGLHLLPCLSSQLSGTSTDYVIKCDPVFVPLLFKTSSDQGIVFHGEHIRYKDDCTEPEFSDIFNHDDSLTYFSTPCGPSATLKLTDCAGTPVVLGDLNKDDCSNWRIATPDAGGKMMPPGLSVRNYNYDESKKEIVETETDRELFLCCFQYKGVVFQIPEQNKYCNAPKVGVMNKDKWCKPVVAANNGVRQPKGAFSKEKNEQLHRKLEQTVKYHEKKGSPSWLDTLEVNENWAKCICPDKFEGFTESQYEQARLKECKPLIATPEQLYTAGVINPFPLCDHRWPSLSISKFMTPAVFIIENDIWEMPDRFKKKGGSETNPCYVDSSYKERYTNDGNPELLDFHLNPLTPLHYVDDCGSPPFNTKKEAVLRAVTTGDLPGISEKSIVCCYEYPGHEKSEEQVKTCSTPDAEVFLGVCKLGTKIERFKANPHLLQHNNRIVARVEYEKGKGNLNYLRDHEATVKNCLCILKDPQPTIDSKENCECMGFHMLPCLPDHFSGVSKDFASKCGPVFVPLLFKSSPDHGVVFYGEHTRYKDDCTEPEFSDTFNHDDSLTYSSTPCGSGATLKLTDCAGKLVVLGDVNIDDCSNWRIATPDSTGNMIQPRLSVRAYNYDGSKKEIVETKSNRKIFLCCFQYKGEVFQIPEQDKYCNAPNAGVMNKDKWCKPVVAANNGIRQPKGGFSKEKNEQLHRKLELTVRYHEKRGRPSWLETLAVNEKWTKCICPDKIEGFNEAQYEQARLSECKPLIPTPAQLYSAGVIDPFPLCDHKWPSLSISKFMTPTVFIMENDIWEMPDRFKKKGSSETNPCYVDSSYKERYTNDGSPELLDFHLNPLTPLHYVDDCGSPPFNTKKEAVLRAVTTGDLPGISEKSIVCCYEYPGYEKSAEQVKACSMPDAETFLEICKLGTKIERFKSNPYLLQHNNRIVARVEYEKGKGNLNYLRDHEATVKNCLCILKDPQPTIDSKESCECMGFHMLPCLPDHFSGVSKDFASKCGPVFVPLLFKSSPDHGVVFYGEHTRYKDDCTEPEFSDTFNHDDSLTYSSTPCGSGATLKLTDCAGKLVVLGDVNIDDCSNWRIATPDSTGNMIQPRLSVRAYNYDGSKKEIVETKSNRKIFLCCFQYKGEVFQIPEQDKYCNAPNAGVMNKDKWCKPVVAANNGIRQPKGGFSKEKNEQLHRKLELTVRYHEKRGRPSWLETLAVNEKWTKCICPDKIEGFNEAQYEQARLSECKPLIPTPAQLYSAGVIDPFPLCDHKWPSLSISKFMTPTVFIMENDIWEMPDRFKKKGSSETNPCYVDSSYKERYTNDGSPELLDFHLNPLTPLHYVDDCGSPPFNTKKEAVLRAVTTGDLPGISEKSIVCCYEYPGYEKSAEQVKACSMPDAETFLEICKLGTKIERFKSNPYLLQHNNRIVARIEYEKGIKGNLNYLRDHEATVNNCLCKLKDPQPTIDSKENCECSGLHMLPCLPDHFSRVSKDFASKCGPVFVPLLFKTSLDQGIVFYGEHTRYKDDCTEPEFSDIFKHDDSLTYFSTPCGSSATLKLTDCAGTPVVLGDVNKDDCSNWRIATPESTGEMKLPGLSVKVYNYDGTKKKIVETKSDRKIFVCCFQYLGQVFQIPEQNKYCNAPKAGVMNKDKWCKPVVATNNGIRQPKGGFSKEKNEQLHRKLELTVRYHEKRGRPSWLETLAVNEKWTKCICPDKIEGFNEAQYEQARLTECKPLIPTPAQLYSAGVIDPFPLCDHSWPSLPKFITPAVFIIENDIWEMPDRFINKEEETSSCFLNSSYDERYYHNGEPPLYDFHLNELLPRNDVDDCAGLPIPTHPAGSTSGPLVPPTKELIALNQVPGGAFPMNEERFFCCFKYPVSPDEQVRVCNMPDQEALRKLCFFVAKNPFHTYARALKRKRRGGGRDDLASDVPFSDPIRKLWTNCLCREMLSDCKAASSTTTTTRKPPTSCLIPDSSDEETFYGKCMVPYKEGPWTNLDYIYYPTTFQYDAAGNLKEFMRGMGDVPRRNCERIPAVSWGTSINYKEHQPVYDCELNRYSARDKTFYEDECQNPIFVKTGYDNRIRVVVSDNRNEDKIVSCCVQYDVHSLNPFLSVQQARVCNKPSKSIVNKYCPRTNDGFRTQVLDSFFKKYDIIESNPSSLEAFEINISTVGCLCGHLKYVQDQIGPVPGGRTVDNCNNFFDGV